MNRDIIVIDFDGVIHRYSRGDIGTGEIYDLPSDGALDAISSYLCEFDVYIQSSRASTPEGTIAIKTWLSDHGFPDLPISDRKPSGEIRVIIDDRGINFSGKFPSLDEVRGFRTWWQR